MAVTIETLLAMSADAPALYRPTSFWAAATKRILADLDRDGFDAFRGGGAPLSFFTPTYGSPGNSLSADQCEQLEAVAAGCPPKQQAMIRQWVRGESHALSDYRAFAAAARGGSAERLFGFSESTVGAPRELFEFDGRRYSRSALNYLTGLAFLSKHVDLEEIRSMLEIGGGFGSLGHIAMRCWPGGRIRYVDVDIPPTCLFADYYLEHSCAEWPLARSTEMVEPGAINLDDLPPLTVLPNWRIEDLRGALDLFVNFISFQEMEPDVVRNYLHHVDRLAPSWILMRNMREGKQKRSERNPVGVETPITVDFYAKELTNYRLEDQSTVVFGHITSDGFHSDLLLFRRR